MHAFLKFTHGAFGAEEVRKNRAVPTERLLPSRAALADRIFQMTPHRVQGTVRIADVSTERVRTVGTQELFRLRGIYVFFAAFFKQSKRNAGIQQARELFAVRRPPAVEDPQFDGGEHGLRAAERINQIKNDVGCGHSLLALASHPENAARRVFLLLWYRSEFLARDASEAPYTPVRNPLHRGAPVRRLHGPAMEPNLFQPRRLKQDKADANQARAHR